MKLAFFIVFTICVISGVLFSRYKLHQAFFKDEITKYRETNAFFEGALIGILITSAIVLFLP